METIELITEHTLRLPENAQKEVLDFVEFISSKQAELNTQPASINARQAGLHADCVSIADDFDAPLPDNFWLGTE